MERLKSEVQNYQDELDKQAKQSALIESQFKEKSWQLEEKRAEIEEKSKQLASQQSKIAKLQERLKVAEETTQQQKELALAQKTQNLLLQSQYQEMWRSFQGQEIHKTYLKSNILSKNFSVFEISLFRVKKEDLKDVKEKELKEKGTKGEIVIRAPGAQEQRRVIQTQEEVSEFFGEVIPQSIIYGSSKTIFLLLLEPGSVSLHKRWIEEKLKEIKVLYGVFEYPS
jgi:hypothetical protein